MLVKVGRGDGGVSVSAAGWAGWLAGGLVDEDLQRVTALLCRVGVYVYVIYVCIYRCEWVVGRRREEREGSVRRAKGGEGKGDASDWEMGEKHGEKGTRACKVQRHAWMGATQTCK